MTIIETKSIIENVIKNAKGRHWLKENIHCIARYRQLLDEQKKQKNLPDLSEVEKNRVAEKFQHLNKKINGFIKSGRTFSLSEPQTIQLNRQIVEELKKDKDPEIIFHQFLNGKARI